MIHLFFIAGICISGAFNMLIIMFVYRRLQITSERKFRMRVNEMRNTILEELQEMKIDIENIGYLANSLQRVVEKEVVVPKLSKDK